MMLETGVMLVDKFDRPTPIGSCIVPLIQRRFQEFNLGTDNLPDLLGVSWIGENN